MSRSALSLATSFLRAAISAGSARCWPLPGKRRGWRCRRFTHPPPQHALCRVRIQARLGNRNAPLGHQPCRLNLDLVAGLPSRHIHSPVPWSRSYPRVHKTRSRPLRTHVNPERTAARSGSCPTRPCPLAAKATSRTCTGKRQKTVGGSCENGRCSERHIAPCAHSWAQHGYVLG